MENTTYNQTSDLVTSLIMGLFGEDLNGKGFHLIHQVNKTNELIDMLSSNVINVKDKIETIQILTSVFTEVSWNVCIMTNSNNELAQVLIKELLNTTNVQYQAIIRKCLGSIYAVIDVKREDIECIYQSLACHFRYKTISKDILLNHIQGLNTLYGDKCSFHKPNNFFYFNGSGYIVIPCISHLKIKEGFSISIWFYTALDQSIIEKLNPQERSVLIEIKCENDQKLSIILNQMNVSLLFKTKEDKLITLLPKQWYHFSFIIEPKKNNSTFTHLFYSASKQVVNLIELQGFLCSNSIVSLSLFHNFIGKATSILFLDKKIPTDALVHLAQYFPYGFYKSKQVKKLTEVATNSSLISNTLNLSLIESNVSPNNNNSKVNANNSKLNYYSMIYSQLKLFYVPFQCKADNLEDICGNINGQIFYNADRKYSQNDNINSIMDIIDVCITSQTNKNIVFLGGINPILPIVENLLTNASLISNQIVESLLQTIIIVLDVKKKNNITQAFNDNFFQCLSIFFEHLPNELFTNELLNNLIRIANKMTQSSEKSGLAEVFFTFIFFNEKIIKKFTIEDQVKLWNYVANCFDSAHYVFINNKGFMSIGKICVLLRYYDSNQHNLYCCTYHGDMFNNKTDINIPDIKAKTSKLIQITELILSEAYNRNANLMTFIKMLTLDLSPCLQKGIIGLLINFFSNEKIPKDQLVESVKYILYCRFLDIMMYCISLSLFDVRVDIISLLAILFKNYKECLQKPEMQIELKKFIWFIKDNVYPNNLFIGIDNNLDQLFEEEGTDNDRESKKILNEETKDKDNTETFDYSTPNKKLPRINKKRKTTADLRINHLLTPDSDLKLNQDGNSPNDISSTPKKKMLSSLQNNKFFIKSKSITNNIDSPQFSVQNPFMQQTDSNFLSSLIIGNETSLYSSNKNSKEETSPMNSQHLTQGFRRGKEHKLSVGLQETKGKIDSTMDDHSINSLQQEESNLEVQYNKIKYYYENNAKSIITYYKEINLFTLTNQMLSSLCEWLLTEDKLIENDYLLEIIIKLLLNGEIPHIEVFIRILNDIIMIDDRNNHILLFHPKFYSWLIEVLFQTYLLVYQDQDKEFNSVLKCSSENKKSKTKQLLDTGLSFHSLLMLRAHEDDIDKINEVLLIGSKLKKRYNNAKKFSVVINNYIRLLLNELLKNFVYYISSQIEQNVLNKGIDRKMYYRKMATVASICYEFILFYNIEQKHNLTNETTIEISIFPDFLMLGMNLINNSSSVNPFEPNASSSLLSSIWSDYELHKHIMLIFQSFWIREDFNDILDDLVTKRVLNDKLNEPLTVLLSDKRKVSLLKVISALHTISIIISQDKNELTTLLNNYTQFIQLCIILSLCLSPQSDDYQSDTKEFINTIAFGLLFLYEETERKTDKVKEIYRHFIIIIFNSIVKIIYYSIKLTNKNKKQFFRKLQIKTKKKINLRKCGLFQFFNEYIYEINSSGAKEIILNEKVIEIMMIDQTNQLNQLIINEKISKAFISNSDLRNSIRDFFFVSKFEKSCTSRLIKMARYHPIFTQEININELFSLAYFKEKCRLADIVHNIMPFYKDEMMKCTIEENSLLKTSIKLYQKEKKKLYSWRGLWSNHKLFFEDTSLLKYKISNHLGSNLYRPLIIPIIDIDYYMPNFSQFNKESLFVNKNKEEHNANMNISSLLKLPLNEEKKKNENQLVNEKKCEFEAEKGLIITSKSYLYSYPELTNVYNELRQLAYNSFIIPQSFELRSNKMFNCCYVKITHHIKGTINFLDNTLVYFVNKWFKANDEDFDDERKSCFGSLFSSHQKDNDILSIEIAYKEIKYIFKRTYFYKRSAIEIFTSNNKSYFFCFFSEALRIKILNELLSKIEHKKEIKVDVKDKSDDAIGYEVFESKKGIKNESSAQLRLEQWQSWKISTFDFLLWLNICANRSFSDLLQYPVFPWIIAQYSNKTLTITDEHSKELRDLKSPMGMIALNEQGLKRKNEYIETFNMMKSEKTNNLNSLNALNEPYELYYYGSLYSNAMYVSHFLTRLFPFANILIELQGNRFDDPNRLFFSIEKTFNCATTQKVDIRELCPEFYYLPEMFINLNDLDFGISSSINPNVELPPWCENNPYEFVIQMKEHLESPLVCTHINKWIDLVFGYKQKGKEAESAQNLFMKYAYEDFSLEQYDKDQKFYYIRLADFGLVPHQLFSKEVPNRKKLDSITFGKYGKQLTQTQNLRYYYNKTKAHEKLLMLKMKIIDNDKVIGVFNNSQYTQYKFTNISQDSKYQIDLSSKKYIPQSTSSFNSKMNDYYKDCEYNCPIVIYNNGKIIAQAGYWDGHISIYYNENNVLKCNNIENPFDPSPVIVLSIDKEERIVIAGSMNGLVTLYKISDSHWERYKMLCNHSREITAITINNALNMFASSSKDGYVMLYTLPLSKFVRCIKLKNNVYADQVFLSASPLPAFIVYSKESSVFYCYSINGFFLNEVGDEHDGVFSPVVFSDYSFSDFLVNQYIP